MFRISVMRCSGTLHREAVCDVVRAMRLRCNIKSILSIILFRARLTKHKLAYSCRFPLQALQYNTHASDNKLEYFFHLNHSTRYILEAFKSFVQAQRLRRKFLWQLVTSDFLLDELFSVYPLHYSTIDRFV